MAMTDVLTTGTGLQLLMQEAKASTTAAKISARTKLMITLIGSLLHRARLEGYPRRGLHRMQPQLRAL